MCAQEESQSCLFGQILDNVLIPWAGCAASSEPRGAQSVLLFAPKAGGTNWCDVPAVWGTFGHQDPQLGQAEQGVFRRGDPHDTPHRPADV